MKNKVINLFGDKNVIQNEGVKYSGLLEKFIEPFIDEFKEYEYYEDIIEFAINAWNFGNMSLILPKEGNDEALNSFTKIEGIDADLLIKMIDFKKSNFKEYTNFIADFKLQETENDPILTVITQEEDKYLAAMFQKFNNEVSEIDFEEKYINRSAIIIKPLKPFFDWYNNLYPNYDIDINETNTYLISDDENQEEEWIKKNFDKIFSIELESWHKDENDWPKKRNYKMFKEWFYIDISSIVYDFETTPITRF